MTPAPQPGELVVVVADLDVSAERRAQLLSAFSPREEERYRSFAHDVSGFGDADILAQVGFRI